jgi:hypothetical protein
VKSVLAVEYLSVVWVDCWFKVVWKSGNVVSYPVHYNDVKRVSGLADSCEFASAGDLSYISSEGSMVGSLHVNLQTDSSASYGHQYQAEGDDDYYHRYFKPHVTNALPSSVM